MSAPTSNHYQSRNHIVCPNSDQFAVTALRSGVPVCSQCREELWPAPVSTARYDTIEDAEPSLKMGGPR